MDLNSLYLFNLFKMFLNISEFIMQTESREPVLKANLKASNEIAYAFTTWRVNEKFRKYSLDLLYFIDKILDNKILSL